MPAGPNVFKKATRGMVELAHKLTEKTGLTEKDVDKYVPHQANGRILDVISDNVDSEKTGKIIRTVEEFGNMSGATVPVALAKALREGTIKRDDLVTLVDMGSGLTFGGALIRI
jgi:3-oxoacyl-[acyl-carrier-protein] synthase-3